MYNRAKEDPEKVGANRFILDLTLRSFKVTANLGPDGRGTPLRDYADLYPTSKDGPGCNMANADSSQATQLLGPGRELRRPNAAAVAAMGHALALISNFKTILHNLQACKPWALRSVFLYRSVV